MSGRCGRRRLTDAARREQSLDRSARRQLFAHVNCCDRQARQLPLPSLRIAACVRIVAGWQSATMRSMPLQARRPCGGSAGTAMTPAARQPKNEWTKPGSVSKRRTPRLPAGATCVESARAMRGTAPQGGEGEFVAGRFVAPEKTEGGPIGPYLSLAMYEVQDGQGFRHPRD